MKRPATTKAVLLLAAVGGIAASALAFIGFANGVFYGKPAYLPQTIVATGTQTLVSPQWSGSARKGTYFNYACSTGSISEMEPYGFFVEQAKVGSAEHGKLADWLIDTNRTKANILRSEKEEAGRGYRYVEYNFSGADPRATERKHMLIWETGGVKVVMLALDRCMPQGGAKEEMVRIADSMRPIRFSI